jgi:TPR repeat protein
MYADGLGVPQNPSKAMELYQRAAEGGEFFAQIELGRAFSRGSAVAVDRVEALRWYSAAASQEAIVEDCEELREAKAYLADSAGD